MAKRKNVSEQNCQSFTVSLSSIPKYLLAIQDTDGARHGCDIICRDNEVTLKDMSVFVTFSIGGTKIGSLCGGIVVSAHNNMTKYFCHFRKTKRIYDHQGQIYRRSG